MKKYYFYIRFDSTKEAINTCYAMSRYNAAVHFAQIKQLDLKTFLRLYAISR
jgi:hypothetical protein